MRLSRIKFGMLIVLPCFALLLGFSASGHVSAHGVGNRQQTIAPSLSLRPYEVVADQGGCTAVLLSGSGYSHSTAVTQRYANLSIVDSFGTLYFSASSDRTISIPTDASGNFTVTEQICGAYDIEPFVVMSTDSQTALPSNPVSGEIVG